MAVGTVLYFCLTIVPVISIVTITKHDCLSNLRVDCGPWKSTALDDYVRQPDPHYQYKYITKEIKKGYSIHFINMTSQKWLNESIVSNPVWWHIVSVIVPDKVEHKDSAFLWIDGGSNSKSFPKSKDWVLEDIALIALETNSIVAQVGQIPNQPTVFKNDPSQKSRKEDAVIAYAWEQFVQYGFGSEILPRLPMTKAVVRAMDTVTAFVKNATGNTIDKYMVAGASKRGWTTWTTAAVDKRVVAMAPVVMDLLNFQKSLHHHYRSLGGWTLAFRDYYAVNFTVNIDNPRLGLMASIVDPLVYKDRYTMPKLVISATGDEFFIPDDSYYYYSQLKGPKYLRMVPNAEHSLIGHRKSVINSLANFWLSVLERAPLPTMGWLLTHTETGGGKILLNCSRKPSSVTLYQARTVTPGRRDFRLIIMGPGGKPLFNHVMWYSSSQVKQVGEFEFEAQIDRPPSGYYAAFFIQVTFEGVGNSTLEFTTETNIVPNTFPFPDCHGVGCKGVLV